MAASRPWVEAHSSQDLERKCQGIRDTIFAKHDPHHPSHPKPTAGSPLSQADAMKTVGGYIDKYGQVEIFPSMRHLLTAVALRIFTAAKPTILNLPPPARLGEAPHCQTRPIFLQAPAMAPSGHNSASRLNQHVGHGVISLMRDIGVDAP